MKMSRVRVTPILWKSLVLIVGLLLVGCGSSDESDPTATSAPPTSTTVSDIAEEATPPETEDVAAGTAIAEIEDATPVATPATPVGSGESVAADEATPVPDDATSVAVPATPDVADATPGASIVNRATPMASPEVTGGTVVANLGCWSEEPSWAAGYPQWSSAPEIKIDPTGDYTATIETNRGTIVADLYAGEAPDTVNNFICLATEGYYDGVVFHRVIDDFMIQTGDPTGTGRGGPGYQFEDELPGDDLDYDRGVLAMANAGPNTNGSQFFINQGNNAGRLQKNYTIFGKVVEGMDVVDRIASIPVSANAQGEESVPAATVTILSVVIEEQ